MEKTLEITLSQDLESGEVSVKANRAISFNIALRLFLTALKGLKTSIVERVEQSDKESLIKLAFGDAYLENISNHTPDEAELKESVLTNMEAEMYDMINLTVSSFLDEEFPRVNAKLSLTEEAAAAAGLDRTATPEELVQAEKDFINNNPDLAAQCQELQPTEVKEVKLDGHTVS